MTKRTLTASGFRLILIIAMFVVMSIGTGVFWLTDSYLKDFAVEVNHKNVDATASQSNVQTLQQIQQKLADNKEIVEHTSEIVAESKSYEYQDQIITDLNDYAAKSGISITNMDFSAASAPAATPGSSGAAPKTTQAIPTINGVKSVSANITLKNPVNYNNLLKFIKSIEQNLTKMQISRIGLSKDATSGEVTSDALTIEVYVR